MATNLTNIDGLLKNVYGKFVEKQQNLSHKGYDQIEKSAKQYNAGGKGFFGAINEYGNESGGAIAEEESFRSVDSESYQQYKVSPKVIVWPVQISGLSAKAADSDPEAFADALVDALDMARERMTKDLNRQFYGQGNGLLASVQATTASNVTSFSVDSAQYLRANMVIDIFNGATKTVDSKRISDVDKSANVVYFATSLGAALAASDALVKENIRDTAPSDGKECMGLAGIIDDSTLFTTFENLDASSKRIWRAVRIDASSGNNTSDLMQRLIDDVQVLGGELLQADGGMLLLHPKQRRKYLDIVVPQKRYMDQKLDAGHSKISFNGVEMFLDEDCQDNVVYGINKKYLQRYIVEDISMGALEDSSQFLRLVNQDVYQGFWRAYLNFGTSKRNAHGKIVSLAKPSGIS